MNASAAPRLSPSAWVVTLLAAVLFLNYVDRGALPTAAPLLQRDLHLDNEQLGLLFSAFFWVYAFIQIPVGWLAERYGAHRILAAGLAIWAAATMLMGFANSFAMVLILRLLLGFGESAAFPAASKIIAAVVPVRQLGQANGIVAFAYSLGPAFGIFAGGLLIDRVGWRGCFVVFGACSLLWLLPWARVKLPSLATAQSDAETPSWSAVLRQRGLWGTAVGLFCSNYMFYFMLNWLPDYLVKERGFSLHEMEQLGTAGYVTSAGSALVVGWAIDRYIQRQGSASAAYKWVMFVTHAGTIGCMVLMVGTSRPLAVAGMFVFQFFMGALAPGIYAMSQILAGPRAAGRWVGIQNSVGNLSGMLAPWITGIVIDRTGHFTLAFVFAGITSALGIVFWVGIVPKLTVVHWEPRRSSPRG